MFASAIFVALKRATAPGRLPLQAGAAFFGPEQKERGTQAKGTIINFNRAAKRAVVSTHHGISLIETSAILTIGDEVEGALESLGTQIIGTARGRIRVFIEDTERTAQESMKWVWSR
jgi:hypothetical protein